MPSNTFYNEILTDHNLHPGHKHDLPDAKLAGSQMVLLSVTDVPFPRHPRI